MVDADGNETEGHGGHPVHLLASLLICQLASHSTLASALRLEHGAAHAAPTVAIVV